ncbi:hypothetical protein L7F22_049680 [Adiantum nelumboides]|nr:hypothetical protein [Adiantum nelumboides]
MASCKVMHAFCLVLFMLLLASVNAASATRTGCANQQQQRRGEQWRQQLRACDDYMRQSRQSEGGGCGAINPLRDQPSQQCCQNLQRISSQDRCRALREVYGGRQQGEMDAFGDLQTSMQQRASRLLQQCNLRPGDCSDRSRDEGCIVNKVDEVVW